MKLFLLMNGNDLNSEILPKIMKGNKIMRSLKTSTKTMYSTVWWGLPTASCYNLST